MKKRNYSRKGVCISAFVLLTHCVYQHIEAFPPVVLNDISNSLVSFFDLSVKGTTLKQLPCHDDQGRIRLELTYPNNKKILYTFTPTEDGNYYAEVTSQQTGKTDELIAVGTRNGGPPKHIQKSIVEKYADLDFSKTSRKILGDPFTTSSEEAYCWNEKDYEHQTYLDKITANNEHNNLLEKPKILPTSQFNWHLYLVGGLTTTVMMTGVVYIIKNINACARYISRKDIWSSWRSEKPWGLLLQLKPSMIAEEIIHDIHSVYYQKENPIELFFKDIEEETDIIMQWIQFRNIVTGLFLPVPPELEELEYRLELLNIMRRAVHYWQAQQWQAKKNS